MEEGMIFDALSPEAEVDEAGGTVAAAAGEGPQRFRRLPPLLLVAAFPDAASSIFAVADPATPAGDAEDETSAAAAALALATFSARELALGSARLVPSASDIASPEEGTSWGGGKAFPAGGTTALAPVVAMVLWTLAMANLAAAAN